MKIKIIKKKDLKSVNKTPFPVEKNKRQKARREMSSTVSGWVDEFRLLRGKQQKRAFDRLFPPLLLPAQSS